MSSPLRLVAWCLFLFLPLAQGGEVVFAYYNLQNYLVMNRRAPGGESAELPKPEEEVRAVISMLKAIKPDILGLAEIGDETMVADLQSRLKKAGMDLPHVEWVPGSDGVRHLALLSRYPIVERDSQSDVPLELNGQVYRMGRGILDATVDVDGDRIRFVGIHLKSKRQVPQFDEAKFRANEAVAVRGHIDKRLEANPGEKLLLFGDLNDTKNEFPVKHIAGPVNKAASLRILPLVDSQGKSWTHHWAFADIYSRIDFLMVSSALMPGVNIAKSGVGCAVEWEVASDHRPLFTTIAIQK